MTPRARRRRGLCREWRKKTRVRSVVSLETGSVPAQILRRRNHENHLVGRHGGRRDQVIIKRAVKPVVLAAGVEPGGTGNCRRLIEDAAKIDAMRFPMIERAAHERFGLKFSSLALK